MSEQWEMYTLPPEEDEQNIGLGVLVEVRPGEPLRKAVIESFDRGEDTTLIHVLVRDTHGQLWSLRGSSLPSREEIWAEA